MVSLPTKHLLPMTVDFSFTVVIAVTVPAPILVPPYDRIAEI